MSENELRDQLRFLIQLKEDGLIHRDVLTYVHSLSERLSFV